MSLLGPQAVSRSAAPSVITVEPPALPESDGWEAHTEPVTWRLLVTSTGSSVHERWDLTLNSLKSTFGEPPKLLSFHLFSSASPTSSRNFEPPPFCPETKPQWQGQATGLSFMGERFRLFLNASWFLHSYSCSGSYSTFLLILDLMSRLGLLLRLRLW